MTENERILQFQREVAPHLGLDMDIMAITDWLRLRGFFTAPASVKHHGNQPGGLFDHSLCVMRQLVLLTDRESLHWTWDRSPYLVGFFHDLCKVDQYYHARNDEGGNPVYAWRGDTLLRGHGEKSAMLVSTLTRLTEEEVACIRYHMGAFTDKELWQDYTNAIHSYPNVLWTHTADMIASHVYMK